MVKNNKNVIQKSMGWSLFSEIAAKFVTPITNMILARILMPEAFGVLAICNMFVSFVDIITDAGFGKYLVQHDFKNEKEKRSYADVAFWSNLTLSILLFVIILLNRTAISRLLEIQIIHQLYLWQAYSLYLLPYPVSRQAYLEDNLILKNYL